MRAAQKKKKNPQHTVKSYITSFFFYSTFFYTSICVWYRFIKNSSRHVDLSATHKYRRARSFFCSSKNLLLQKSYSLDFLPLYLYPFLVLVKFILIYKSMHQYLIWFFFFFSYVHKEMKIIYIGDDKNKSLSCSVDYFFVFTFEISFLFIFLFRYN